MQYFSLQDDESLVTPDSSINPKLKALSSKKGGKINQKASKSYKKPTTKSIKTGSGHTKAKGS